MSVGFFIHCIERTYVRRSHEIGRTQSIKCMKSNRLL